MTQTNVNVQMQIRRDTSANWSSTNPVLLAGEWGYVTDTGKFKIGNGSTTFNQLPEAVLSTYGGVLTDHLEISNSKEIRLTDAISNTANEHYSSFKASGQSQDINYTLPSTAPTDNQYLKCTAAGVLSWDTFTGTDLADLVSNDANNRVLTATGTTNSFNAEANLEFNASHLTIKGASASTVLELQRTDANTTGAHGTLSFTASDGHSVASIGTLGDGDNEGGKIVFRTTSAAASNDPFNAATPVVMTIDAAGKLGIGTALPNRLIHGVGASPILKLDSTNNEAYIQLKTASPSNESYIGLLDGNIYFSITGTGVTSSVTEKFRVEKTGDVFLPDGNVNLVSGHGIHFHNYGTGTNISSNLLDDYEEGTYVPTDTSGANLSLTQNTTARYTKIGRLINVQFDISWPSTTSTAMAAISLPFSGSILYGSGTVGWTDIGKPLQIHISTSAAIMDNDSSNKHTLNSELSGKRAIGSFNYIVS